METGPWFWLPEQWWQFADVVERARAAGLTTTAIAWITGRSVVQIEAVECLRRHAHAALERAARA
jgi:hypothetical protein